MQLKVGSLTDIGKKRKKNQDTVGSYPDLGLFLVSDGMGGHQGGETASSTTVESIFKFVEKEVKTSSYDPITTITKAIQQANETVYQLSLKFENLKGMGTTTTALLFQNDKLVIAHVGDSRCYYLREGGIWQVTKDHSLIEEHFQAGLIPKNAIKNHPQKNIITRSVGYDSILEVDIYQMNTRSEDCFLICSDGLTNLIEDQKISKVLDEQDFQLQKAAENLVALANAQGGDDNISVLLVQVT
jgi:protein phosphatase